MTILIASSTNYMEVSSFVYFLVVPPWLYDFGSIDIYMYSFYSGLFHKTFFCSKMPVN